MADDDVDLAAPTGIVANDEIAGKKYQRIKSGWGGDGTWNETDITSGKPFPVQLRGSDGTDRSGLIPVAISSAIPAGTNNIGDVDIASAIPAGTNNIGDVDIASIAAGDNNIGNVDIVTMPSIPAGTNNIGDVDVLSLPALPVGTNNIGDVDVVTLPVAFNTGAANATTQRVTIDTNQMSPLGQAARSAAVPVSPAYLEYETVPVSTTNQMLGATGNVADYIEALICVVATAATSQVQLKDGNGTAFNVLENNVGGGVGTYYIPLGLKCVNATSPGWQVTTAAGVTVIAIGDFT